MELNVNREEILNGNIVKGLIKLALPLMLLNLINTLYSIVDTYFVAKIGELQVGAITLVSPITGCGIAFSFGLSAAGIAMIARSLGENNNEKANKIATHLIILAISLGIIITLTCVIFSSQFLGWLNTPSDIYEYTFDYYIAISFDYVFLFLLTIYQAIRQSSGDSKSGARINIIASLLNCVLDPLFIFVFKMGTFGAALATVLSKALMCPFVFKGLYDQSNPVSISFKDYKIDFKLMLNIIKVSIPASLGHLLSSFGFVLMSREIVSYGSIVMSGYGIGSSISSIFYIPVDTVGLSLPTYIGQNLGANNPKRAKQCYSSAIKIVLIISLVTIIIGLNTCKYFVFLFIKDASDELLKIAVEYASFCIATSFFMGWFNSLCGVFDGSTNTKISMILSAARILFIRMPIVYLLARVTNLQYTGIWVSMIISNFITCSIGQILYFKYPWDKKAIKV